MSPTAVTREISQTSHETQLETCNMSMLTVTETDKSNSLSQLKLILELLNKNLYSSVDMNV